ncbi:ribosome silencing factor [Thalassotalea mangrovi]|uniref:Ribosomal silencing factor RsfS n=1 Tax=Thalassotalea mangrovi TaxID=2572245 RepID=A0A4U1B278_9GAMM|nr:ribosome silencing factor [Thalassotalea mangrovi]TKB43444.1 ribosome silencing factor [Thalassotalea mangrovi]
MQTEQLLPFVIEQLEEIKARDIVTLDVRGKASFTDYMVVCCGNSTRHVKSIAEHLALEIKKQEVEVLGIEGTDIGEWALIDLGDIVVHVMTDEVRDLYQLEKLWAGE